MSYFWAKKAMTSQLCFHSFIRGRRRRRRSKNEKFNWPPSSLSLHKPSPGLSCKPLMGSRDVMFCLVSLYLQAQNAVQRKGGFGCFKLNHVKHQNLEQVLELSHQPKQCFLAKRDHSSQLSHPLTQYSLCTHVWASDTVCPAFLLRTVTQLL